MLGACGRIGFDASTDATQLPEGGIDDSSYRASVLSDHPVGYWRLGHPTRIVDEMGGPDGTAVGGCTFGDLGALTPDTDAGMGFDATCYLDLGPGFEFVGVAPFTVEAWIESPTMGLYEFIITRQQRGPIDPIDGYSLLDSPSGVYFERITSTSGSGFSSNGAIGLQFTHVAGVFDGALVHVYVDGDEVVPAVSAANSALPYAATLLVGAAERNNGTKFGFFEGTIDEVAVYDHVVPPARLMRHYQIGTGQD
jgi:hypothetical protein